VRPAELQRQRSPGLVVVDDRPQRGAGRPRQGLPPRSRRARRVGATRTGWFQPWWRAHPVGRRAHRRAVQELLCEPCAYGTAYATSTAAITVDFSQSSTGSLRQGKLGSRRIWLLTLDGPSVQRDPDGSRRIVWMINRMIKQAGQLQRANRHPTGSLVRHPGLPSCLVQRCSNVTDLLDKSVGSWNAPEPVTLVERSCRLDDGVHHDEPGSDDARRCNNPRERVRKKRPANALPVQGSVKGKPRQQNSRNLVRVPSTEASRQIGTLEQVCSDGVVGDHRAAVVEPDEGS
jgi:hypothetical protein